MRQINEKKISIDVTSLKLAIPIFPIVFYCSSRMSFGDLIPFKYHVLLCNIGLLLFILSFVKKRVKFNLMDLDALLIILIVCLWDNWDLKNGVVFSAYIFFTLFSFYIFASKSEGWAKYLFKVFITFGMFYAFWTVLTWLSPTIYYKVVFPIVEGSSIYDLSHQYNRGRMPGFTSHYSTNGLYLATGICFTLGYYFFNGGTLKNVKMSGWISFLFQLFALLLTGKRGPVIYLILAFVAVYIVYNTNKPISRYLKLIGIVVVGVTIFAISAARIPALMNFIVRFREEIDAGDVSNGRYVLWAQAWKTFLRNPIFGKGWYWFRYNNSLGKVYFHVHNCFLQWLCELGIIGAIPFFIFSIVMFYRSIVLLRSARNGYFEIEDIEKRLISIPFIYIVYFMCACITGTAFFEAQSLCPYILCCAYTQRLWRKYNVGMKSK